MRVAAELAADLLDILVAFNRDALTPETSPRTGKLKYRRITDVDVATAGALVEVTTKSDATGKVGQLADLLGPAVNPLGLPVLHVMPNVSPASAPARALLVAGGAGVYNDRVRLAAALRARPP